MRHRLLSIRLAERNSLAVVVVASFLAGIPGIGSTEILWSGNYETGDFTQWHSPSSAGEVTFHQVPDYGRPIQYGGQVEGHVGNGRLLSLVAATEHRVNGVKYLKGPTRGPSQYAAKFTVRNSASGSEPEDCDDGVCRRRRSELTVQGTLPEVYDAMPYGSERWLSISHFIPKDWDESGSGWGPMVFQVKPLLDGNGIGPCISISVEGGEWVVAHRWTDIRDLRESIPWQQDMFYSSTYPEPSGTDSGADLRGDFPDQERSQLALANLNKGGWTDWVMHVKYDARSLADGGKGFLTVWKRAEDDEWVKVLHIEPKKISRGGLSFDRGICYNSPANTVSPGGFGIKAGMYMNKSQVWDLNSERVLYNANIKVGSATSAFSDMAPDGSSPGSTPDAALPKAPLLVD